MTDDWQTGYGSGAYDEARMEALVRFGPPDSESNDIVKPTVTYELEDGELRIAEMPDGEVFLGFREGDGGQIWDELKRELGRDEDIGTQVEEYIDPLADDASYFEDDRRDDPIGGSWDAFTVTGSPSTATGFVKSVDRRVIPPSKSDIVYSQDKNLDF